MRSGHHFEVLHCKYKGSIWPKMRFGHNFWLEGPIDLRPMRLNCILQDLFRDNPLDHIWRAHICAQICQIWPNMPKSKKNWNSREPMIGPKKTDHIDCKNQNYQTNLIIPISTKNVHHLACSLGKFLVVANFLPIFSVKYAIKRC